MDPNRAHIDSLGARLWLFLITQACILNWSFNVVKSIENPSDSNYGLNVISAVLNSIITLGAAWLFLNTFWDSAEQSEDRAMIFAPDYPTRGIQSWSARWWNFVSLALFVYACFNALIFALDDDPAEVAVGSTFLTLNAIGVLGSSYMLASSACNDSSECRIFNTETAHRAMDSVFGYACSRRETFFGRGQSHRPMLTNGDNNRREVQHPDTAQAGSLPPGSDNEQRDDFAYQEQRDDFAYQVWRQS